MAALTALFAGVFVVFNANGAAAYCALLSLAWIADGLCAAISERR